MIVLNFTQNRLCSPIVSSQVFCFSKIFSRQHLVGPKIFLVGFHGSKIFSCRFFVYPIFFLVADFMTQRFSVAGCMRKSGRKQKYRNNQTMYFFSEFISAIVISVYIRKVLHLLNCIRYYTAFICTNCSFSHLFSSVLGSLHS